MRLPAITIATLALGLAACGPTFTESELSKLGECARALNLQVEALERADRVRRERSQLVSSDQAGLAVTAASRYRDLACKDDALFRMQ